MPDFVTLGETCVVLVAKTGGPLRYAAEFERRLGGAESTVAVGVARLGFSAGWMSCVGADEFGTYVRSTMRAEGVDVAAVRTDTDAPTGVFFRENRASGHSSVFYYRKGSAFSRYGPDDIDEHYISSARILHVTGITLALSPSCRAAVERAVAIAKDNGVEVVFDPNYRAKIWSPQDARPVLERIMTRADHVLAGQEDLTKLTGLSGEAALLDYLHGLGLPEVVLKLGKDGAVVSSADRVERIGNVTVARPVDRFGVGDSFAAGFIAARLRGEGVRAAAALGNAVAGYSIGLPGNIEALPTFEELEAFHTGQEFVRR